MTLFLFGGLACEEIPDQEVSVLPQDESISLISDKKFKNGFYIRGLGEPIYPDHAEEETTENKFGYVGKIQYGQSELSEPVWEISQWSTRYSLHDVSLTAFSQPAEKVYRYENPSKLLQVDTKTGQFTLGLKGSACYVYGDRIWGQEWPSFFLERSLTKSMAPSPFTKIDDLKNLFMMVDVKMDAFEDCMKSKANPDLHAAQLMYYLYLSHRDPNTRIFDDMIWFGLPVFDNRSEKVEQLDFVDSGTKGTATECFIYTLSTEQFMPEGNGFFKDGRVIDQSDDFVRVCVDVLPYVRPALNRAQASGCMLDTNFENLYVSGFYIGFELPGTYDIQMSFKNLDIRVVMKSG